MAPAPKHSPEQQEAMILNAAAECIAETSLMDFTMSAISKRAGLSMGSVYKHIQTKEDVLVALATLEFGKLREVFSGIFALPLSMPERMMGIELLDPNQIGLLPFSAHLQMLIGNESMMRRASRGWHQKLVNIDRSIEQVFLQALIGACEVGELLVEDQQRGQIVEEIQVAQWAMGVGFIQVSMQREARQMLEDETRRVAFPINSPDDLHIRSVLRLINSYPWREPLQRERIDHICTVLQQHGYR